jgi:hypothetical protein
MQGRRVSWRQRLEVARLNMARRQQRWLALSSSSLSIDKSSSESRGASEGLGGARIAMRNKRRVGAERGW